MAVYIVIFIFMNKRMIYNVYITIKAKLTSKTTNASVCFMYLMLLYGLDVCCEGLGVDLCSDGLRLDVFSEGLGLNVGGDGLV